MSQRNLLDPEWQLAPAEQALALNLVTDADLLRLKTIARLHARGLPADVGWADLLQEAFTRVLNGARRRPEGVPMVAFLAGVMRSIKAEHWRRALREARSVRLAQAPDETVAGDEPALLDLAPDPERTLIVLEELAAVDRLFADDPIALQIIAGLGEGLSAEEIRAACKLSKTAYDSGRKRMRRVLFREGLRLEQP
jgi:DNA-directed RNA polymerase specialized sigma24 family protein